MHTNPTTYYPEKKNQIHSHPHSTPTNRHNYNNIKKKGKTYSEPGYNNTLQTRSTKVTPAYPTIGRLKKACSRILREQYYHTNIKYTVTAYVI